VSRDNRVDTITSQEPYILSKDPYISKDSNVEQVVRTISSQKPYIPAKKPHSITQLHIDERGASQSSTLQHTATHSLTTHTVS